MNAAEREALRALTDGGAAVQAYAVGFELWRRECAYCSVEIDYEAQNMDLESFPHAPDCPITIVRELLQEEPPPPTPHEAWQAAVLAAADRVAPLSHGGTNKIDNIQPLCLTCNVRKNARYVDYREGV